MADKVLCNDIFICPQVKDIAATISRPINNKKINFLPDFRLNKLIPPWQTIQDKQLLQPLLHYLLHVEMQRSDTDQKQIPTDCFLLP